MFKKRLMPLADANNTLVLLAEDSGCCGGDYTTCKYRVVIDPLVDFDRIIVSDKGVEETISLGATITDYTLLPAAIRTAIKSAGYITDNTPGVVPKDVVVSLDGTELTVDIWGECVVVALKASGGTETAAPVLCTSGVNCLYTFTLGYVITGIAVDGGASESLNAGAAYVTTDAATIKADLEGSTYLADATQVTVTEDTVAETFAISFYFPKAEVGFNDVLATRSGCTQDFVA